MAVDEICLDCSGLFCFAGCFSGFVSPYASQMKCPICYFNINKTQKNIGKIITYEAANGLNIGSFLIE
jgi:hypothetical protein